MTIRESLNILDTKAIDGEGKFLDLRNLYEAAKLDYDKKKKLKELIDRNEDAEVIAAYLESDGEKLAEDLDDTPDQGLQVSILGKLFDADPSTWQQAVEAWGYDITPYATADEFLENVDTLELLNKFAELVKNNDYLNNSWYELFDFTEAPLSFDFDESLNESSKSNASLTFKNNSGALELYAYNYVDPDLSDEEAIEYKERPYWKNWYKTRSEAVEDYKIIDSICNKYNVRIWPHDNHTFNNKNEVEIVGPSKNIIKKALNELRRRYDFEMIDESLKEDFDPKSYNQALDDYMSSKNISVEKLFGALNYDDPRYIQLFKSLKDLGYEPRETGTYPRGYFVPAMTITVPTKEVPDDLVDLIHKLAGVTGRHVGFHRGANNWKLKFELRDDDFSSFRDKIFQSLNESTWNDEKGNPQASVVKYKRFKIKPSGSAQYLNIYDSHNELVDSGFKTLAKAKKFCDENEDLAESLNQDVTDIPLSTIFKMNPDKFAQFCRTEGWLQGMPYDDYYELQYDIAHEGRNLFALANDIWAYETPKNLTRHEIAQTLFDMMQDEIEENLKEEGANNRKVYVVEPHKIDMDLYDIVFIDNGKRASSKRFESYEDAVKFIKKNAKYNNWIAGNKADFQSKEDKLTDFGKSIKSSKINESLNEASYGGAYDIEDDMFFTRDDLDDFGYAIAEELNDKTDLPIVNYAGCWIDRDWLELTIECDGYEASWNTKIDMRRIRTPRDLFRKYGAQAFDWFEKTFTNDTKYLD